MSNNAKQLSAKRIRTRNNVIVYIVLSILAVIWLFPVAWVVMTSFRAEKGSYVSTFFPKSFTLDNYIKLFTDTSLLNFPQMFMNTLFIAICSCILATFYVLAVSYCLSRLRFKMRKPYMNMAMILGLFPGFMSMVAVYFILKALGMTEGNLIKLALILVYSGGAALSFQIAKGFFDTIPKEIDEAALIDGCSPFKVYTQVLIPILKPTIISTAILELMWVWNDYLLPTLVLDIKKYRTIPMAVQYFRGSFGHVQMGPMMASIMIDIIPIIIVYLVCQKYIIEGVVAGAVKG